MKKIVGYAVLGLFLVVVVGLFASGMWRALAGRPKTRAATNRTLESTPARMERGKYLVENVTGCLHCHSDRDWKGDGSPVKGREGAGTFFYGAPGTLYAPNITPDKETGVGAWSDDELARAIREGVSRDGRALFPIMPYMNYRQMSDEDLAAVIVYLRTIPSIRNGVEKPKLNFPLNFLVNTMPQPLESPVQSADASTPAKRGEHLLTLSSCSDCHTPQDQGAPIPGMFLAGGFTLNEPPGEVTSTNITPDASGIPYYDEILFLEMMRTGHVKARKLNVTMPWNLYGKMTDNDLKAIFAYLKTVPSVSHKVDNAEPPTSCKVCKGRHGFGDRN